jgi:transposase
VNTKFAILDAGYYDDENITALYRNGVSFVTRLKGNRDLYKYLVAEHLPTIERCENLVSYNGRYAFIKCIECELVKGYKAYAYISLDIERENSESKRLFFRAKAQKLKDEEVFDKMTGQGVFILVSSEKISKNRVLPTYYTRQQIEEIFDIGKNS